MPDLKLLAAEIHAQAARPLKWTELLTLAGITNPNDGKRLVEALRALGWQKKTNPRLWWPPAQLATRKAGRPKGYSPSRKAKVTPMQEDHLENGSDTTEMIPTENGLESTEPIPTVAPPPDHA